MNSPVISPLAAPPAAALREALLTDREQTLTLLYQRTFPMVRQLVRRQGGTVEEARDVFHDALVVFYEKTVGSQLVLTASASTYLVGVSRNLWCRELQRRQQHPQLALADEHEALPDGATPEPAALSVFDFVEQLGERCRSMLLSFYYFRQPLAQIAVTHNYRSVRSATVQKFKCLERLRDSVRHLTAEAFSL
jgi:DNA-directed RNA polymerase specialized sigma24 family protein